MDIETGNKILHMLREIKKDASAQAQAHTQAQIQTLPDSAPSHSALYEDRLVKLLEEINGEIRVMRKAQIRDSERIQNIEKRLNIYNQSHYPGHEVSAQPMALEAYTPPAPAMTHPVNSVAGISAPQAPRTSRVASDVDDIMQMLNQLKNQI